MFSAIFENTRGNEKKLRDLGEYETIFNLNCNFHCSSIKQKIHHLVKVTIHYAKEKWKISILMHFYDENV
jgi:hypothetical protein